MCQKLWQKVFCGTETTAELSAGRGCEHALPIQILRKTFLGLCAIAVYCKRGNTSVICHNCFSHFLNVIGKGFVHNTFPAYLQHNGVCANLKLVLQQAAVQHQALKQRSNSSKKKKKSSACFENDIQLTMSPGQQNPGGGELPGATNLQIF